MYGWNFTSKVVIIHRNKNTNIFRAIYSYFIVFSYANFCLLCWLNNYFIVNYSQQSRKNTLDFLLYIKNGKHSQLSAWLIWIFLNDKFFSGCYLFNFVRFLRNDTFLIIVKFPLFAHDKPAEKLYFGNIKIKLSSRSCSSLHFQAATVFFIVL